MQISKIQETVHFTGIWFMVLTYCIRKSLPMKYRKITAKIRLSSHNLSLETGRLLVYYSQ